MVILSSLAFGSNSDEHSVSDEGQTDGPISDIRSETNV